MELEVGCSIVLGITMCLWVQTPSSVMTTMWTTSSQIVWFEEILDIRTGKSLDTHRDEVVISDTPQVTAHETPSTIILRRSDSIIREPDIFMFLGKAYEATPEWPKSDLITYEKIVNGVDTDC
jgi:hypothetical protein